MSINLILILISIWVGVIIFFSAIIAPTVFKSLPEKEAGAFLRSFFPKYYNFGLAIGIISVIYLLYVSISNNLLYMVITMTLLTLISKILIPHINSARDCGESGKNKFKQLHLLSVILNVITLILGVALLVIYI